MRQLVIEYVLEGHQRGYNYTSPTSGFNDDTLKTVWRTAMPRGQGWGAEVYRGARSLKSFRLPDGRMALADVVVTGQRDESGRAGIRRAVVDVMLPGEYLDRLKALLRQYPQDVRAIVERKPWMGRRIPKVKGDSQVLLSHPYTSPNDWQVVEALVLEAAREALDHAWMGGRFISFTTLALAYQDETQLVVLPEKRAVELSAPNLNRIRV